MTHLSTMPIEFVASTMGAVTLSGIYASLGFTVLQHLCSGLGIIVGIAHLIKSIRYPKLCYNEYCDATKAGIYPTFSMLIMLSAAYLGQWFSGVAKYIWFTGICIQILFIIRFVWTHIIKNFNFNTYVPSWCVNFFGLLVASVIGKQFNEPTMMRVIVYYGFVVFVVIYIPIVIRLMIFGIPKEFIFSQAILLAPPSLILSSYLVHFDVINIYVATFFYGVLLTAFLYLLHLLPQLLDEQFSRSFGALTFPTAISTVASLRMSHYLASINNPFSNAIHQIAGIQLVVSTLCIGIVLYNFLISLSSLRKQKTP